MENKLGIKIILSLCFVTIITAVTAVSLQSSHAFSWPHIDKSDGKAQMLYLTTMSISPGGEMLLEIMK